jgi:isoleucyl-tRNA synthetase
MSAFKDVPTKVDFPAMENALLAWWDEAGIVEQYLHRNDASTERFSFIDGPITANNPMGVHHAWGRTYKDFFQRFHAMLGKKQRFQNGFDCQGLWVEVEVEKELGLKSKRDIETYGIAEFVERCKERVIKYAGRQTDQSIRLGYWMDWDNSYFTMSEENNYTIWHFLKVCHEKGYIYKGHDVMPWCPRCGTGISEHEIVTEGYQDRTHLSIFVKFPLLDEAGAHLLAWTTTPWTLTSNVAAAVNPEIDYLEIEQNGERYYLAKDALKNAIRGEHVVVCELKGADLVGRAYSGPFDELPAAADVQHRVIAWKDVDAAEGTGIVHIAPGCGKEDFALGKELDLAVIAPINEFGHYVDGFDWLTGQYVHEVAQPIKRNLAEKGLLYRDQQITHRYPVCWRCSTDLVFRLVDEWFISMDELRTPMMNVTRQTNWVPSFGLERELDWLGHMDDWMISKKRYWGLALPIFECETCNRFDVVGSREELQERAVAGWESFEGHTPHRPHIDAVKIGCPTCGGQMDRIKDVGNPWLDAGIVPYSTLNYLTNREKWEEWFPADLISESFPGQFRNWFYSMIAQTSALTERPAFLNVFSYALMRDDKGEEMHKSKGNAIWFDDAADEIGVDTMRWLFTTHTPSQNLNFGQNSTDEVRRQFILPLWNSYSFFITYAKLDGFNPLDTSTRVPVIERSLLDRWIISRLNQLVATVRDAVLTWEPQRGAKAIEEFVVEELSNWYIRRNRRRFWKSESDADKAAAYHTLYECLTTLAGLLAPFTPFITEEMYQNLVVAINPDAPASVHLTDYPVADSALIDEQLSTDMAAVLEVVRLGRSARTEAGVKVRQPLAGIKVYARHEAFMNAVLTLQDQVLDELNIKSVEPLVELGQVVTYDVRPNLALLGPRYGKQLGAIRQTLLSADASEIAVAIKEGPYSLTLADGSSVLLEPSEVLVDLKKAPGYAAAQGPNSTIVLDTELTPELVAEGNVRDFIRGVQDARKDAGLRIEDRIHLSYQAEGSIAEALTDGEATIRAETLAVSLVGTGAAGSYTASIKVGDASIAIGLTKAES